MIQTTMAFRNTIRQPRRTILLGGAIALGVIIICLASGFTSGMEAAVQDNVTLLSAGHILVNGITASESGRSQNRIVDASFEQKVRALLPEAVSISRTAQSRATVVFGSREQQLNVRGVDWKSDRLFSGNLILTEGDWKKAKADRAVILGAQSARRFGLGLGDSVFVRMSTVTGQQNVTEYALGAVYDDSAAGGMTTAFVPLSDLLVDLNMKEGQYQSLAVFLNDAAGAEKAAAKLTTGLKAAGVAIMDMQAMANAARQAAAGSPASGSAGAGSTAVGSNAARSRPAGTASAAGTASPAGTTSAVATPGAAGNKAAGKNAPGGKLGAARAARRQAISTSTTVPVSSPALSAGPGAEAGAASGPGNPGEAGSMGGAALFGQGGGFGGRLFGNQAPGTTVYRVSTITQLSGQMGAVLGSVRWIGITIFLIMLVLTAAGITNTYRMVLMERTREIGMMRCIGFKRKDVFRIFVYEAGLIAIAGSLAGILASLPVGLLIHLIRFDPSGSLGSALSRGHLVFEPNALSLLLVSLAVIAASVLAVIGPARRASRLQPVEALRTTA
jgi:ABC-type lipoprotein release transport system permease subunit